MKKSWKSNNEYYDCAFIGKNSFVFLDSNLYSKDRVFSASFFEKGCETDSRDSYQQSFYVCFWNIPENVYAFVAVSARKMGEKKKKVKWGFISLKLKLTLEHEEKKNDR